MSKKTIKIYTLLYMSEAVYTELYTNLYLRWCMNQAKDQEADLQHILANSKISNWYNNEFGKLEQQFAEMASPQHEKLGFKKVREIYHSFIEQIFGLYPQPLIEAARKLNIIAN